MKKLFVPKCSLADDAAASERRKKIAEMLRRGERVNVEHDTGRMVSDNEPIENKQDSLNAPKGKLA